MNVRMNFDRLFREMRVEKLRQQLIWLRYVATKTAPDNAIILYFYAYLQWRVNGEIDPTLMETLITRLRDSAYWQTKFAIFGLSEWDVMQCDFPETLFEDTGVAFKAPLSYELALH